MERCALVIGGGIGGLTTAIALQQDNIDAPVFERAGAAAHVHVGGGIHLWHNAMRAIRMLGLADRVAAVGSRIHRTVFRSWNGRLLAGTHRGVDVAAGPDTPDDEGAPDHPALQVTALPGTDRQRRAVGRQGG